ncbi:hypothetical protein EV137_3312 [Kribbella pratensis]|uniref:Prolyl aminopeptidase n=1 Tax=Kribbella pratensis TaxID=2512112 RepID=A0ABY2FE87_9ACTN|nr:hypothetical protein [Kribbella pratensis]TDW89517.1 hypothetical protein EV137_3312 [Kribbella pratensis]
MYPDIEPYDHGMLDVGDGHRVYWEVCGDPAGKPALVVHGRRADRGPEHQHHRPPDRRFRDGVPEGQRDGNLALAYSCLLHDPDPAVREKAARDWCDWEDTQVRTHPGRRPDAAYDDPVFRLRFARLVTHYWAHAAWLEEDVLVREAGKLAGIPGVLIHGRLDISGPPDIAWRMAQAWPGAELHLVEQEGHGAGGRRTTELILAALDHFALRS